MDPVTAWALATKAIAEMITEIVKDQPPAVKAQMWDWWVKDTERLRSFLHIGTGGQ